MTRFLRAAYRSFEPYIPGEQKSGIRIKLNTNESPYPPSPRVAEALAEAAGTLMRYPPPDADDARDAAARRWGVSADEVLVGNGSDEILRLVFQAYLEPGESVVVPSPTYTLYKVLADSLQARCVDVPRDDDYGVRVRETARAGGKIIALANPNSPTGTVTPEADIRALLKGERGRGGAPLVLVDEAYADFCECTAVGLIREFDNLIVLRTLSKSYGLAGLRVGFGLARPEIIAELRLLKDSYNVGALPNRGAVAALNDETHARGLRDRIVTERERLAAFLVGKDWKVYPSGANFLFAEPPGASGAQAKEIFESLRARGILVRWFGHDERTARALRITIGTREEIEALMEALEG